MGLAENNLRGWYQRVSLKFVVPPRRAVVGLVVLSVMERRDRLVGEHVTTAGSRCPVISAVRATLGALNVHACVH